MTSSSSTLRSGHSNRRTQASRSCGAAAIRRAFSSVEQITAMTRPPPMIDAPSMVHGPDVCAGDFDVFSTGERGKGIEERYRRKTTADHEARRGQADDVQSHQKRNSIEREPIAPS